MKVVICLFIVFIVFPNVLISVLDDSGQMIPGPYGPSCFDDDVLYSPVVIFPVFQGVYHESGPCSQWAGSIMTIRTAAENAFVQQLIVTVSSNYFISRKKN